MSIDKVTKLQINTARQHDATRYPVDEALVEISGAIAIIELIHGPLMHASTEDAEIIMEEWGASTLLNAFGVVLKHLGNAKAMIEPLPRMMAGAAS